MEGIRQDDFRFGGFRFFRKITLSILKGVRQGDDFRFQALYYLKQLSVLEGVQQGDDIKFRGFRLFKLSKNTEMRRYIYRENDVTTGFRRYRLDTVNFKI